MAATSTNDDRGTSHAISHCISLPAAGEGGGKQRRERVSERERKRKRESRREGGVKVLDNCSTMCACWELRLQSEEATRTYLCCKWMHSTEVSPPGIFIVAHPLLEAREKSYALITSLHPYGATNEQQQFAPLVRDSCAGLTWDSFKCGLRHDGPPEVCKVTFDPNCYQSTIG